MIIVDKRREVATNTDTGGSCDVCYKHGRAYTDIAGLVLLENGAYTTEQLSTIIRQWHRNHSSDYLEHLKPLEMNGKRLYLVAGWETLREIMMARRKTS